MRPKNAGFNIVYFVIIAMILVVCVGMISASISQRTKDIADAISSTSSPAVDDSINNETPTPPVKPVQANEESAPNRITEAETLPLIAALSKGETESSSARNTVKLDMRNSGYSILVAISEGKIKEGTPLKELENIVPRAFQAHKDTGMAIIYNPNNLNELSFCGWVQSSGSITDAIIYDARADKFAPTSMNCNGNPYILAESMKLSYKDSLDAVILPAGFKFPGESQTIKDISEQPTVENVTPSEQPLAPKAEAEPVNIPWGGIIITAFILLGLAALVGLGFGILNLSGRVRKTTQARTTNINSWELLVKRFNAVNTKWVNYEIDIVKILDFPLMSDMREKATLDFHDALQKAKALQPADLKRVSDISAIDSPFAAAVDTLESTFRVAESEAQRIRWSNFSVEERKRLKKAKDLLNLAMNEASTENERQSAYKMMQKELDGIILVPKAGILRLEKSINLLLTDGVNS